MIWICWTNVALGLWLALSAFVQPQWHSRSGEDVATGLFIVLASWWALGPVTRRRGAIASWTVALLGCWAALAPWLVHHERLTVWVVNDLVVGMVVAALAGMNMMWRDQWIRLGDD